MTKQLREEVKVYHRENRKWIKVKGRTISNFFDGQAVIVHRNLDNVSFYSISDKKTGCRISGPCKTQIEAVECAFGTLREKGTEGYRYAQKRVLDIIKSDQTNIEQEQKDREYYECENKKEINDFTRTNHITPITTDMILDMAKVHLTIGAFQKGSV